jgi:glycerol kinase
VKRSASARAGRSSARPGAARSGAARLLAIDQGTTGTTVLLLDDRARVTARGYAELPQHFPRPGWVEHRGEEIWDTTLRALRAALRGARAERIAAIGITNQRETAMLWDRRALRPAAPAIVWQDRRTAERCEALRRAGHESWVRKRTGLRLDPYFSATKVEWLLAHDRDLRARARRGAIAFGTVDSWLVAKLTGGAVHATEPTTASRTLLYDIRRRRWDPELAALFGVPEVVLPEVRPSAGDFGNTRGVPGLPDGIPIRGIAGDQQAALFGQGCVRRGGIKNTYGTGCFLMLHTGAAPTTSRSGLLTTAACGPRGEPAYALEGSVFIAGAAVQWLRDGLGIIATSSEVEALARSVPDAGGTVLVPAFAGLGAPWWRPDVRGVWSGLTRGTTRGHLARAALESIAFQTCDVVAAMEKDARARVRALRVDGGAAANDLLMQTQADLLGIPITRPAMLESTALGAALLAGIGVGIWRDRGDVPVSRGGAKVFRPRISARERKGRLEVWTRSVGRLLGSSGKNR